MKNNSNVFLCLILLIMAFSSTAQSERKVVREGNKLYQEKKYGDAEVKYKKSLNIHNGSLPAQFNLGAAYYKQEKYDDAIKQYTPIVESKELTKNEKAQAYHNLGNAYLQSKKYEESVDAYKHALKLHPADSNTRYNLAYAQAMLKKDQQQNGQNKKQQDQQQDEKKDGQGKQDQQKEQEQKQAQQKRQKISKEDAEKILQSLNNDEKNKQKKLLIREAKRGSIDKNW